MNLNWTKTKANIEAELARAGKFTPCPIADLCEATSGDIFWASLQQIHELKNFLRESGFTVDGHNVWKT